MEGLLGDLLSRFLDENEDRPQAAMLMATS